MGETVSDIVLETERLILRKWRAGDSEPFLQHLNTRNVMRWLGGVQSREKFDAAITRLEGYDRDFGHTFWIVERKADAEILGFCGLKRVNAPQPKLTGAHEIGWRLREDAWGKGYAKEAASAAMDFVVDELGWDTVIHSIDPNNHRSRRVAEKLGSRFLREDRLPAPFNEKPIDIWGQSAAEWRARRR